MQLLRHSIYLHVMDTALQKLFRNYQQMDAVYQRLHVDGLTGKPYLVKYKRGNQLLTFFGCRHTNDIHDEQNSLIEKEWQEFVTNQNERKIAFCEGGLRPYESGKELAIEKYSESGLLTWLAKRDNVPLASPEPEDIAEINYLLDQQFKVSEIMTYYFGRQMHQWLLADYKHNPNWQQYAKYHIASYAKLEPLHKEELDLSKVLEMFKQTTGQAFSEDNEKLLYKISAPTSNEVSAASGLFRNISLFEAMSKRWRDGTDVFAIYGSGHAIVLEPAFLALIGKENRTF